MTGPCENEEVNIADQVNEDFYIVKGTLELMAAAGSSDLATIEPCIIPVIDNLQGRVNRIEEEYQKLYRQVHPLPEGIGGEPHE